MDKCVLGEFNGFVLNCEGNLFGGIQIWEFLRFYSGIHVELLRRGGDRCCFGGIWVGGSELPWHAYGWAWFRMSEEFLRTAGAGEGFEWEM
jgi:hypothetical protein